MDYVHSIGVEVANMSDLIKKIESGELGQTLAPWAVAAMIIYLVIAQ